MYTTMQSLVVAQQLIWLGLWLGQLANYSDLCFPNLHNDISCFGSNEADERIKSSSASA